MINFEHTNVMNIENAFRGMRNPLNSWDKSDSYYDETQYILGTQDLQLAKNLIVGGTEHRKFLRNNLILIKLIQHLIRVALCTKFILKNLAQMISLMKI